MSFLMRGTGSGKKFILLCWAGPCSITALIHCLLVGTVALFAAADVRVPVVSPAYTRLHRRFSKTGRWLCFSFLWGHCSFPLGLGICNILFVFSKTGVSVTPSPVEVL